MKLELNPEAKTATIKSSSEQRTVPIYLDSQGFPEFAEPLRVGVRLGKSGQKIWLSNGQICRNTRYSKLSGNSEFLLSAYSPLNSINRDFVHVQIVDFWDNIPENLRSRR
jgi:hypothetical protein